MNKERAIFVGGRQHCGNTMLSVSLGRHSQIHSQIGEGIFFESWPEIESTQKDNSIETVIDMTAHGVGGEINDADFESLNRFLRENIDEEVSVLDVYKMATSYLCESRGKSLFAQKATSYVFQFSELQAAFRDVKFIFMIRNPYDLSASIKRRGGAERGRFSWRINSNLLRMLWGWRSGVKLALRYKEAFPSSFKIVRYEDVVADAENTLRDVCGFIGVDFEDALLAVPHVNKSESKYNTESQEVGVQSNRVGYFKGALSDAEISFVRFVVPATYLNGLYDGFLGDCDVANNTRKNLKTFVIFASGAFCLLLSTFLNLMKSPLKLSRRLMKRLV